MKGALCLSKSPLVGESGANEYLECVKENDFLVTLLEKLEWLNIHPNKQHAKKVRSSNSSGEGLERGQRESGDPVRQTSAQNSFPRPFHAEARGFRGP